MAKKPLPAKRAPAGGPPSAPPPPKGGKAPPPPKPEAVGKFDKFATFALALPSMLLALTTLIIAIGYTSKEHDIGLFGFPKKSIVDFDSGSAAVSRLTGGVQISGFETHNYIGRLSEGEVDVAVLNVGYDHNVNLGDVFTLAAQTPADVHVEFVVFDVTANSSRAYILLGQNVTDAKDREFSLSAERVRTLCGGTTGIEVRRLWKDQIIRRYCEARSNVQ